jgi:BirA family biotin operon repressor/biotin-[acetyl-CoA-carboxylase] ligase
VLSLIDAAQLAAEIDSGLWRQVSSVAATGSTNLDLAQAARAGAAAGMVRVADFQSSGRGRLDRSWTAPPGAMVAVSIMLRPRVSDAGRWLWLPLLGGLAVVDGLRVATGARAELKWPNDVLLDGKKICGILAERVESEPAAAVVIGMGINTRMTESELPVPTATSLAIAGLCPDPGPLAAAVLNALAGWYRRWEQGADLLESYSRACATIGKRVNVVVSASETFTGQAVRIDQSGRLVVSDDSQERVFSAGDIVHLR